MLVIFFQKFVKGKKEFFKVRIISKLIAYGNLFKIKRKNLEIFFKIPQSIFSTIKALDVAVKKNAKRALALYHYTLTFASYRKINT